MLCRSINDGDMGIELITVAEVFEGVAVLGFDELSVFAVVLNEVHEETLFVNFDDDFGIRKIRGRFQFEFKFDMGIVVGFEVEDFDDIIILRHVDHGHIIHGPIGAVEGLAFGVGTDAADFVGIRETGKTFSPRGNSRYP